VPIFAFFTLILFYLVWAAMHDLAHGDEGTFEWTVLAVCAAAFPLLYRQGLRILTGSARLAWLAFTGFLVTVFSLGATSSILRPKYPKDPMLGMTFLSAGVPILGTIGYHLLRDIRRRRGPRPV